MHSLEWEINVPCWTLSAGETRLQIWHVTEIRAKNVCSVSKETQA